MRKKRNTQFKASDFLAVFVCSLGIAVSSILFVKDINNSLEKSTDTSIGYITFKYRTAQRRFLERVIWDRLRHESPIYNGDTIRTAGLSEATVYFADGNILNLHENTLAQVFENDTQASVIFSQGTITLDTTKSASGVSISAGSQTVAIESGSRVQAASQTRTKQKNEVNTQDKKYAETAAKETPALVKLQIIEGSASVSTSAAKTDGRESSAEPITVTKGEVIQIAAEPAPVPVPAVYTSSPVSSYRILNYTGQESPVHFTWKTENLPADSYIRLETSADKNFGKMLDAIDFSHKDSIELSFKIGTYYWRIRPYSPSSPDMEFSGDSGTITILDCRPPQRTAPSPLYTFTYRTKKPSVKLAWEENSWAAFYTITVAGNKEMKNPVETLTSQQNFITLNTFGQGTWFWQVTPSFAHIESESKPVSSEIYSFTVLQQGDLKPPAVIGPEDSTSAQLPLPGNGIHFSWERDIEAAEYILDFSSAQDFSSGLQTIMSADNYFSLKNSSVLLQPGTYFWRTSVKDNEGNISAYSESRSFTLLPESPAVKNEKQLEPETDAAAQAADKAGKPDQKKTEQDSAASAAAEIISAAPIDNQAEEPLYVTDGGSSLAENSNTASLAAETDVSQASADQTAAALSHADRFAQLFCYIEPEPAVLLEQETEPLVIEIITGSMTVSSASPGILFFDFYELSDAPKKWNSTIDGMEPGSHTVKMVYADGYEELYSIDISPTAAAKTVFTYITPEKHPT